MSREVGTNYRLVHVCHYLPNNTLIKPSDDSARVSLITESCGVNQYVSEITNLVIWRDVIILLNAKKNKEMSVDPRGICEHSPVYIQGEEIEGVSNLRYLGVHVDDTLNGSVHVDACSVCQGPAAQVFPFVDSAPSVPVKRFSVCATGATVESVIRYGNC